MSGPVLILMLVATVILMIVAISRFKVHPFIAIMALSLLFGLAAGIPLVDRTVDGAKVSGIASVIGAGFSSTFSSIGIVIILGALIGSILEATGAALKFADLIIKAVGKRHPVLAMQLMGWVVSIAVFCDSGFVILNPIRKALVSRTGASSVAMTFGLSSGLYLSHVFIPPTPGPIAAASTLGIGDNLLLVMGLGALCSIFPIIAGLAFANYIGRKVKADDEGASQSYEELIQAYGALPGALNSIAPILVPLILMGASSVVNMAHGAGFTADLARFLGTPIIALSVGVILAFVQLATAGKKSLFQGITEATLKSVGPILFITAAGGVLGKVIASTELVTYITEHADALKAIGIFFPFLLAALLKTSLGSSTVAITTTAGIVAPMLTALGFDSTLGAALVCMAIGAGAMTVSHANDSYFWVVTNFGALSPQRGYRVQSLGTLILGLSAMAEILLLSLLA
ncbi:MAG: GntP family permease [Bacteroidales bacterium]|nr:GntP family permease [Bacteroidales bacterium]